MRLWTVQPLVLYERLQKEKVIHCGSDLLSDAFFKNAYQWMAEQMKKRIGPPPNRVLYPIWAWHTIRAKHTRPDLRWSEFRHYDRRQVCIEVEIPNDQILLSDEITWHIILNDGYFCSAIDNKGIDTEYTWYDNLPDSNKQQAKINSWERVFDLNAPYNPTQYIQATFWELHLEQVINVRVFRCRL